MIALVVVSERARAQTVPAVKAVARWQDGVAGRRLAAVTSGR